MASPNQKNSSFSVMNNSWKSTCKILFGQDIGDLSEYEQWLSEYIGKPKVEKSALSGNPVHLAVKDYSRGSKFLSFDEIDFNKTFDPLNINEIKDIDCIVSALAERFYFTGNVILGNSNFVEGSSNISDSHYVYNSAFIFDSKYVACSEELRECNNVFGFFTASELGHIIKGTEGYNTKRCFECHSVYTSSDCYFSCRLENCRDCIFSFGSRNKSHCIGNLPLPKDKYDGIKAKLLSELVVKLKKDKRIFSLLEIIEKASDFDGAIPVLPTKEYRQENKKVIEEAFTTTSSLLLGKELSAIDDYSPFLARHVPMTVKTKSPLSGDKTLTCSYVSRFLPIYDVRKRLLPEEEMFSIQSLQIDSDDLEKLSLDVNSLSKILKDIAYASWDTKSGNNSNMINSSVVLSSNDCYEGSFVYSKKCAFSYWPDRSDHIFGSSLIFYSTFCINSYHSSHLTRSFESDSCQNSSGLYYCHDVENVQDGMFCFNSKSKRHAIGNAELARDSYVKIKSSILEQISSELECKKNIKWDIYTIGSNKL